jgi:hypothetical protein
MKLLLDGNGWTGDERVSGTATPTAANDKQLFGASARWEGAESGNGDFHRVEAVTDLTSNTSHRDDA